MADILIVDDDQQVRELIRRALESAGHLCCEAADGAEALRTMQQLPFDLVITDIVMPEQDGFAMLLAVRKASPGTPVIAISGALDQPYLQDAKRLGAAGVISKPFEMRELLTVVEELLTGTHSPAAARN